MSHSRLARPARLRFSWASAVLWLLIAAYASLMSIESIRQHDVFNTRRADLGHFDQTLWNTLHGRILIRTEHGQQLSSLTDHVEPILIPLSLLYLLWDDVRALLVLQSVAIALGALPLFWLTRDEIRRAGLSPLVADLAGLSLAVVYLLFPALEVANLTEFHATTLMVTPMLFALYYARGGRYAWMWVWALLAISVKEEMSLLALMLALWLVVFRRQWKHGLALAAVSLIWFGVATFVILPRYAPLEWGIDRSIYFERFTTLGGSPQAIVRSLLTRPGLVWSIISEPAKQRYVLGLLASAGLVLPLLAPEILLLGAPLLLLNLLSNYEAMYSGVYHYSAPLVPFLVAAAALGLGRLGRLAAHRGHGGPAILAASFLLLTGSMVYHRFNGHTPLAQGFVWPEVTAHHRLLESRFAPQIPRDATLSATAPLFPHLDHRERIHQFPIVEDATWVLLDAAFYPQMNPADLRRSYDSLVATGEWCIVDAVHGYVLLERRGEGAGDCLRELPDAFCDFARVSDPQPQVRVQADFGDGLRLLGYDITQVPYWRRVGVRLYWQLLGGSDGGPALPAANYRLYPFWLGAGGDVVETTTQRPLVEPVWCPTNTWRPGKTMVTEMLPWDLGPEFRLGLAVMDEANQRLRVHLGPSDPPVYAMDGATWLRLQVFEWQNGRVRPVDEAAVPAQALAAEFDGRLALAGFTLSPADPQAGQEMKLYLLWQAAAPVQPDYTAFVHLLDARGERVAQGDGVPNYLGALPTSLWRVGVPVLDIHTLVLPPDLAPGGYSLRIGWYDPQTGERLTLATGEDSLLLSEVQVR